MNTPVILQKGRLRPVQLLDGAAAFDGEAEDSFDAEFDLTASKSATVTATDTLIDTFETTNNGLVTAAKSAKDITVDAFETSINGLIVTAKASIQALVEASALSPEDKTSLITAINLAIDTDIVPDYPTLKLDLADDIDLVAPAYADLKTYIEGAIDTNISDDTVQVSIAAILTEANQRLVTAVEEYEEDETVKYPYPCTRCKGTGRHQANQDLNSNPADSTLIPCTSCDQLQVTQVPNIPVGVAWSATNTF